MTILLSMGLELPRSLRCHSHSHRRLLADFRVDPPLSANFCQSLSDLDLRTALRYHNSVWEMEMWCLVFQLPPNPKTLWASKNYRALTEKSFLLRRHQPAQKPTQPFCGEENFQAKSERLPILRNARQLAEHQGLFRSYLAAIPSTR